MYVKRFFAGLFVALPSLAKALYVGCPALPEMPERGFFSAYDAALTFKLGYEGDYVLGRSLDSSSPTSNPGIWSMFNAATMTLDIINRIEIYSALGATYTKASFSSMGADMNLETHQNFGGFVGIRANTPVWADLKFGVDAKFFYAWPTLSEVQVNGQDLGDRGKVYQNEWQISAAVSQTFGFVRPYVGVSFAKFSLKFAEVSSLEPWVSSERVRLSNSDPFGIFLGLGFAGQKGLYVDLEGRFLDECALSGVIGACF